MANIYKEIELTSLPNYQLLAAGDHKITVVSKAKGYKNSNKSNEIINKKSTNKQLPAPTNLRVTDTIITFDSVDNATRYDILIDDIVIGSIGIM